MNNINYGIIGYSGKMGHEIEDVMNEAGHTLVFRKDESTEEMSLPPSLLIDFSQPEALAETVSLAEKFRSKLIIGTTGLAENQFDLIRSASGNIAIVQSYNFSVGIQMMISCIELLKDKLPDWDVEIIETHHRFKKDKPSGTAIMLQKALGKEVNPVSMRLGNVPGEHSVYFGGLGEVLSITHSATSRRTFAEGVLLSAGFLMNKTMGFFTFRDVLSQANK